ncbi:unnamed protein product [Chrysoparadoxa australica]
MSLSSTLYYDKQLQLQLKAAGLQIRYLAPEDLPAATAIETEGYPADEAASEQQLKDRQRDAGSFFMGAYLGGSDGSGGGELVGYVCGTCCVGEELNHETMSCHDQSGTTLCIHSVAVGAAHRRRGFATVLLKAYLEEVSLQQPQLERVCLIAKGYLLHFYVSCGFDLVGASSVVHGKEQWFEMRRDLNKCPPRALPFMQVDAFSANVFGGNPAAVLFTQAGGDDSTPWMQSVAAEMNLSETAFLEKLEEGSAPDGPLYGLRWFTPKIEVDLCGHATLASAHALWSSGRCSTAAPIRFSTRSGTLRCSRSGGNAGDDEGWILLDFPEEAPAECPEVPAGMLEGLGIGAGDCLFCGRTQADYLVEITSEAFEQRLRPDFTALSGVDTRGIIVTCDAVTSDGAYDFRSRFFAPRAGINEDPVTGSAHCGLGPYWSAKKGRPTLIGYQASDRGGLVRVTSGVKEGRVEISGKAVTVLTGHFLGGAS